MKKQNRSSIIRIIISNYDSKGIKEIKVRYNKQAQLDTFLIESTFENGIFKLNSIREKAKEKYRYNFDIQTLEKNEVKITKKDLFLNNKDNIIREYKITFNISEKNSKIIVVKINDLKLREENTERIVRRGYSETEVKLIDTNIQKNYAQIACCNPEEIDAIKIYKIKRYLTYRSNMLTFFSLINDFICKDTNQQEIWKLKGTKEELATIVENLKNYITQEIENYNNEIKNKQKKINNKLNNNKLNEKIKKKLEADVKNLEKSIVFIEDKDIEKDVKNIIEVCSNLRHKLFHYEYTFFENLFENKFDNNENLNLTELLDLNIFSKLPFITNLRLENKTNYLDTDDEITILGNSQKAIEVYKLYNKLSKEKNGFNKFINSLFSIDGVEDSEFKKLIDDKFKLEIDKFEEDSDESEYQLMKKQSEDLQTAYILDIHNSKKYKNLYNERKELVLKYNATLNGNRNKNNLTTISKKFVELKEKMEAITKRNAKLRLKYKLQVAYGFLMSEFNGDIKKFKDEFDLSKIDMINEFRKNREKYLNYHCDNIETIKTNIKKSQTDYNIEWLEKDSKNDLFKFYMMIHLLLPVEFKGDFLGFVKKHYYDIKNVEFIDENNDELTEEQLNKMKNDSFFNKIRLFERNNKNSTIFKHSLLTSEREKEYFNLLKIDGKYYEIGDKGIFNKNIIIPLFKYYQIIFKLYNDLEIDLLIYLSNLKNCNLKEIIEENSRSNKNYNFRVLLNKIKKKNTKKFKNIPSMRNDIAHLNYNKFLKGLLEVDINKAEDSNPSKAVHQIINYVNFLDKNKRLDFNYINDYYMRKEQFIFNQLKQSTKDLKTTNEKKKDEENKKLLKNYEINLDKLNNIFELSVSLKNLVESKLFLADTKIMKKLSLKSFKYKNKTIEEIKKNKKLKFEIKKKFEKDSSDILGIYKREVIKQIKRAIIEKIKYNEEKVLNLVLYNQRTKEKKIEQIRILRTNSLNKFCIANFQKKIKMNNEISLKLSDIIEIKDDYFLQLVPDITNKKQLDLRNHYCFKIEYIFNA